MRREPAAWHRIGLRDKHHSCRKASFGPPRHAQASRELPVDLPRVHASREQIHGAPDDFGAVPLAVAFRGRENPWPIRGVLELAVADELCSSATNAAQLEAVAH